MASISSLLNSGAALSRALRAPEAITNALNTAGKVASSFGSISKINPKSIVAAAAPKLKESAGSIGASLLNPIPGSTVHAVTSALAKPKATPVAQAQTVAKPYVAPKTQTPVQQPQQVFSAPQPQIQAPAPILPPPTSPTTQGGAQLITDPTTGISRLASQPQQPAPISAAMSEPVTQPSQRDALLRQLQTDLQPSEEERMLSDRLAALTGQQASLGASEELGLAKIQDQPIALNFIQGQQAALQRQAAAQERALQAQTVPLQTRLAQLQAERARKAEIAQMQMAAEKPVEVGGRLVNPLTGEVIFATPQETKAAEGFTLGEGQARYDAQGNLIANVARRPETIDPYQQAQLDLAERKFQAENQQTQSARQAANNMSTEAVSVIDNLLKHGGLSAAVGVPGITNFLPGTEAAAFKGQLDRLKSLLTLPNLQYLKGLGAMSDREFQVIQSSIGALDKSMPESAFKEELKKIQDSLKTTTQQLGGSNDEEYQYLKSQGYDDNAIKQLRGFNSDLSTSGNGSAKTIAAAIKQVESGGNYNARGGSGESGAYQFMPATWRSLASKFLGNPNAPQTSANQDVVAEAKIQQLLDSGYNAKEIALIWNTSLGGSDKPLIKKGVNQYGVAYDSGAYANKVLGALNKLS